MRTAPSGDRTGLLEAPPAEAPFYRPQGSELEVLEAAAARRLPVLLKGPTGCGKTRLVRHLAWRLRRPLVTVACHDDLSASDLTGRWLVRGGETVWQDGPLTEAVRAGAIAYLDEVVEARQDTLVVLHPLADDRRVLPLDRADELVEAHPDFQLVVSYNPGYQSLAKELKPSTRQRFVAIDLDLPPPELETAIVAHEAGIPPGQAGALVRLAVRMRPLRDQGLAEVPSTRLRVHAGRLIAAGMEPGPACEVAIVTALTDDPELAVTLREIAAAVLP
ncbi:MAG: CbbQ/NirQ/NorQ/GpvN family protein [Myxococcota bacterium]|nr:CbbQ/NirQ/NorQ/GpvN family protein [Myxococcota bacterium]